MTKPMHKKGFHDTFEVVEAPVVQGIRLNWVDETLPFITEVLVNREEVEDGIYEKRTQVLPEEKCPIGDLWTQILEHYS